MKTKVKILVNNNEVYAFFPEEKYNNDFGLYDSYSHIGQHSACHIDYANESRKATNEERKSLIEELKSIGYNLDILN